MLGIVKATGATVHEMIAAFDSFISDNIEFTKGLLQCCFNNLRTVANLLTKGLPTHAPECIQNTVSFI